MLKNLKNSSLPFIIKPDTNYILSVVEWNMYSILNELPAIYHLNYYYPNAYVTFYGHPLFGESLVFLVFDKVFGLNIYRSYVFYLLLMFFLGALGSFLLTKELTHHPLIPYFASFLFIMYPYIRKLYLHLNVVSFFWVGFVFYFLIKFQKKGKWKDALLVGFFAFMQGLFSIYHGLFLIGIMLPLFFLLSSCFRTINYKRMASAAYKPLRGPLAKREHHKKVSFFYQFFQGNNLKLLVSLFIFIILLVVIFSPFLSTKKDPGVHRGFHYSSLVDVETLFTSRSIFYRQLQSFKFQALFPGFSVLFLFTVALTDLKKKKTLLFFVLSFLLLVIFILNLKGLSLISNWIFFITFITYIVVFIHRFYLISPEVKLLFALVFSYFLVFFKFSTLVPGFEFSFYGILVSIFPGLSTFRYLYRSLLILLPVFSALAALGLAKILETRGRKGYRVLFAVFLLLVIENGYVRTPQFKLQFQPRKYKKIEKKSDRIILELPIYGRKGIIKNSKYTINTIFHHNYYVNGRVAFRALKDNFFIEEKISAAEKFPDESTLAWLIENYSVDYLIFNWHKETFKEKEDFLKRANELKKYCKILDRSSGFLVLRLKENFPVQVIKRRYSFFHLKRRKIVLDFSEPYDGKIRSFIPGNNKITAKIVKPDSLRAMIEFPAVEKNLKGIPVEINFKTPVRLKDIRLEKKE